MSEVEMKTDRKRLRRKSHPVGTTTRERVTFALTRGRLLDSTVAFLKTLNLLPADFSDSDIGRRLMFENPDCGIRFLLLRASDVPTFVEYGAADLGIAGSDLLMEQARSVYEPVDLGFGRCRLVLAGPVNIPPRRRPKLRVATKYPNITERYFAERGMQIEIVKLYGAMEIAPLVGVSDQIVDLSDTGETLRANGLVVLDEIALCSARLIANRAALRLRHPILRTLIERIGDAAAAQILHRSGPCP